MRQHKPLLGQRHTGAKVAVDVVVEDEAVAPHGVVVPQTLPAFPPGGLVKLVPMQVEVGVTQGSAGGVVRPLTLGGIALKIAATCVFLV